MVNNGRSGKELHGRTIRTFPESLNEATDNGKTDKWDEPKDHIPEVRPGRTDGGMHIWEGTRSGQDGRKRIELARTADPRYKGN